MRRVRKALLGIALALGGMLLGLAPLEAYLRAAGYGSSEFLVRDARLGWFHQPHAEGWFEKSCFRARVRINGDGLRDVERPIAKPEGVYRILVLGDSMTENFQVELEESYPRVLERLLNGAKLGRTFEVINLGVVGYSTDQEYLALRYVGQRYRPDLVVLAFFTGNDFQENYPRLGGVTDKPHFVLDEGGALREVPFQAPPAEGAKRILRDVRTFRWLWEKINDVPALNALVWRLGAVAQRRKEPGKVEAHASWQWGMPPGSRGLPPLSFQVYLPEEPAPWREAWAITEALIRKTRDEAEQHGARFLLAVLPAAAELAGKEELARFYRAGWDRLDLEKPDRTLRAFAGQEGIWYLSLLSEFRSSLAREGGRWEALHNSCDGHWSPRGNAMAAEALFRAIAQARPWDRPAAAHAALGGDAGRP
ncbi:MAG TPA: GDSL-type esterase/lipase family protein [Candidatus Sulfotelmatobacter sp.]|nr:GDSL-type esterase/lipase family protein [Candidatus Sulfotelmatobacter sp.]